MNLKDIAEPIRQAYITKLALLQYNNIKVPVFDSIVPDDSPDYFVVIKDQIEADNSLKGGFNTDVHITLDIVTRFPPGFGSSIIRDSISNDINAIICPELSADRINLQPEFNVMNSIRTMSRPITEPSKTINIFRKINIYKHEVQQLK